MGWLVLGCLLLLAGCAEVAEPQSVGQLAYIGGDGNVYVVSPERLTEKTAVTADAQSAREGAGLSYHRLAWSPSGQLAYASVVRHNETAQGTLYLRDDPTQPDQVIARSNDHFFIYVYWSPASCTPRCRQLAYLVEEEQDISLRLLDVGSEPVRDVRLGTGWPFYYAWSPNGRFLLAHVGREKQNDPQMRLLNLTLEPLTTTVISDQTGDFQAPAWSSAGWAALQTNDGETQLHIVADDGKTAVLPADKEPVAFSWSPDGTYLAFMEQPRCSVPCFAPIYLYEVATGETRRLLGVGFRPTAFFWSPDGKRLAYLNWVPLGNNDWVQWRVVDVATGEDRGYKMFDPTLALRFTLNSFSQYAQSHRLWSPNGRYLTYADRDFNGTERVWLIDTWAEAAADPILVDKGSLAFWSWQ
ncbi:MAG: hypothetical protein R3C62_14985 [Chloroflexota bacterium]